LSTVEGVLRGPLDQLNSLITGLVEEQEPTLRKAEQYEDTLKMANPDFEVPDPATIREPLESCEKAIGDAVRKAKTKAPERLQEAIKSRRIGRLALDRAYFNRWIVYLPLLSVLLVNLSLGFLQVLALAPADEHVDSDGEVVTPERRLRGSASLVHTGADKSEARSSEATAALAQELLLTSIMAALMPAVMQIVLSFMQTLAARALSDRHGICEMANVQILQLQDEVGIELNSQVEAALNRALKAPFNEVQGKADELFPKFKQLLEQLVDALKTLANPMGALTFA